jgi:hypothetical protein
MRKGISPLISTVMLILIGISVIYIVINVAKPAIDRSYESAVMNEADQIMQLLDNFIREVASEGAGSLRSVVLKVTDGEYRIINTSGNFTGAIQFKIDLKYSPFSAPMFKKVGNLKYSAGLNAIGLVGYWNLNEKSGNVAKDSSGYDNDGTLYNGSMICSGGDCPTWTDGKFGGALGLDGVNDYVEVKHSPSLGITGAITVEAWVKPASLDGWKTILSKWNPKSYWFGCNSGQCGIFISSDGSNEVGLLASSVLTTNTWHHVVGTYDSITGEMKVYVDGSLDNSTITTGKIYGGISDLWIGANIGASGQNFNGSIDEVRIYNRALSAEEILSLYNTKASNYQVVLEYSKIIITGNLKLGKGTHKLCVEKIGELNNKPLIKIAIC